MTLGARPREAFDRFAIALAALGICALAWRSMHALGDSFWYLAAGRWLLDHGHLPARDPFTFTASQEPWMAWSPLSYLAFALLERAAGLRALLLVAALISACAYLLVWLNHARGAVRWALFPVVPLIIWIQRHEFCVRGQVLADLYFALLVWALTCLGDGRAVKLSRARALMLYGSLVLLGAVWMNSHQSAVAALVLVPVYSLGIALEPGASRARLLTLAAAWGAIAVGTSITPYGPRLLIEAALQGIRPISREIDLFCSPDFWEFEVLAVMGIGVGSLVWAFADERRARRGDALLVVAFLVAAMSARRYLPWLGLVALATLGRASRGSAMALSLERRASALRTGVLVVSAALCLLGASAARMDPWRDVPVRGVQAIDAAKLPARVYARYVWGGYLLYAWGPTARTFIDGRLYLFDENEVYSDSSAISRATPQAYSLLDAYQINTVLTNPKGPLGISLSKRPDWVQRYIGRLDVVYVRKRPLPVEELPTESDRRFPDR